MQQGNHLYGSANSTIYNANQSYASIFKFDLQGRKIKSASLEIPGGQAFVLTTGMVDKQLMTVGASQEIGAKLGVEMYSVFLSKFDESLKFSNMPANWVIAYRYPADYPHHEEDYVLHDVKSDHAKMTVASTH